MMLVDVSNKQEVYDSRILSFRVIVQEIGSLKVTQSGHNTVYNLVQSHDFAYHGPQFGE